MVFGRLGLCEVKVKKGVAMSYNVGSRWWKIDFHVHTPASKDFGRGDATQQNLSPQNWLKAAMDSGLDAVVVTDHNTGAFIDKLKSAMRDISGDDKPSWYRPLIIFPGVEIAVAGNGERVHILGVFDPSKDTAGIIGVLGKCGICDNFGDDENAFSEMGVAEVVKIIHEQGGVAIPAHVDGAKGILNGRNSLNPELKKILSSVCAIQVESNVAMHDGMDKRILEGLARVAGSDAHVSADIGKRFIWVKMGKPTISALHMALHDHVFCVKPETVRCPNEEPSFYVKRMTVSGLRYCGRGASGPLVMEFSPHLSSLIGGRGTGKSTQLECLRFAFRQVPDERIFPQMFSRLKKFSDGMFLQNSTIEVEFFHYGEDYRVNWSLSGNEEVLHKFSPESGEWQCVEHGDIAQRFQIGVFSQKQLFELANNPRGLLTVIDRDGSVNREEWNGRWEQKKSEYIQLCVRARELRNRRNSIQLLSTRISDLDKKISEYQSKGYGEVLKRLAMFNRQDRILRVEDDVKRVVEEIGARVELLAVPDFPDELFPHGDTVSDKVRGIYSILSEKTTEAYKTIVSSVNNVLTALSNYRQDMDKSEWAVQKLECLSAYGEMAKSLRAAGDSFDPDMYGRWIVERAQLTSEYAKLETVKQELKAVTDGIKAALSGLMALRTELFQKRVNFIQSVMAGNEYIKMTVLPFGDVSTVEQDLRAIFGIDGDRYASSIYAPDEKDSLLHELINWRANGLTVEQLPEKIDEIKRTLWKGAHGEPTGFHGAFDKRLVAIYENSPSIFNEFSAYWPEDLLEMKFVSNGRTESLDNGSPGQKSAAILAFLLGYGVEPLILDQPEDDLDNSLIMKLVVNQLHVNKQRRQLIIATHNPNIVVNGDSEQVCVMKFAGGQIRMECQNSLDDLQIRNNICDIMEGGADAFKKRYGRMMGGVENV